jgi:hypothetical protein
VTKNDQQYKFKVLDSLDKKLSTVFSKANMGELKQFITVQLIPVYEKFDRNCLKP